MSSIANTSPRATVLIRPMGRWPELAMAELWASRELFWFLVWRDVKLRYRQTLLGVLWVVVQPLMTMAVFAIVLGKLVGVPSDGIPYPLFAFTGLLPWMFFASAVTTGTASMVSSPNLITKVYFPRIALPASAASARLVDFAVGSISVVALMLVYHVPLRMSAFVTIPAAVVVELLLAIGVASLLSSFNVRFRDVGFVVPVALQLGMFATPVLYRWTLVPQRWRWVIMANPLTGIIETYRSALLGFAIPWKPLTVSIVGAAAVVALALIEVRRAEGGMADIL